MMNKKIDFPQYRKYKNNKVYFKIHSETTWEELHLLKGNAVLYTFTAKILPDRNYLEDLTYNYAAHWDVVDAAAYEALKDKLT